MLKVASNPQVFAERKGPNSAVPPSARHADRRAARAGGARHERSSPLPYAVIHRLLVLLRAFPGFGAAPLLPRPFLNSRRTDPLRRFVAPSLRRFSLDFSTFRRLVTPMSANE